MSKIKSASKFFKDLANKKDNSTILTFDATNKFYKDVDKCYARGKDLNKLKVVINKLLNKETLEEKYKEHQLSGDKEGFWDCHIEPDWVLIYRIDNRELILVAMRTGTHRDTGLTKEFFELG